MAEEGALVALLVILVVAVECRSWLRARRGARRLERLLSEMERETVAGTGPAQEIRKCDPQHPLV